MSKDDLSSFEDNWKTCRSYKFGHKDTRVGNTKQSHPMMSRFSVWVGDIWLVVVLEGHKKVQACKWIRCPLVFLFFYSVSF